jgi:lipopolysaccharide biosynthesis glycosyltransferase
LFDFQAATTFPLVWPMSLISKIRSRLLHVARKSAEKLRRNAPAQQPIGHLLDLTIPDPRQAKRLKTVPDKLAFRAWAEGRYLHPRFVYHIHHEAPPAGVAFVSVCNDKYAPGLEALILSLLDQYPGLTHRYIVYHDGNLSPFVQERLHSLYAGFEFEQRDPTKYNVALGNAPNHKRVGLLGYLSLEALGLTDVSRVVILDTDLIVLGDISPLWQGDRIKAVPDIGVKPFGIVSAKTKRPVVNSGVLSLPGQMLGASSITKRDRTLEALATNDDKDIERFADQRFWNVFLSDEDVELLPQNFNCVKALVTTSFPHEISNVSVLHLTGPKPWYLFLNDDLLSEDDRQSYKRAKGRFREVFAIWERKYRSTLLRHRLIAFRNDQAETLGKLRNGLNGRPIALIGNGPSIQKTDLMAFSGFEKVVFNWFIHHPDWDKVKPDHLVVASHMLFGGWNTPRPELPPEYLQGLTRQSHKPRLWFAYYFKSYIESLPELKGYAISYFFFEKPFKRKVSHTARIETNLENPLTDCNTGVLTVGVPLALHRGSRRIVLVGCDSNYTSTQGTYFYAADQHKSKTTRADTLLKTWARGGEGAYGYQVAQRQLASLGVEFMDATLGGSLDMLPKVTLDQVRAFASNRT